MKKLWCLGFTLACAAQAAAQSSGVMEHAQYIQRQTDYNTRYFNNADSYPKPTNIVWTPLTNIPQTRPDDFERVSREYQNRLGTFAATSSPPPSSSRPAPRGQTAAERVQVLRQNAARGDVDSKVLLAHCYYQNYGGANSKEQAYKLYCEAASQRPFAEEMAVGMLSVGQVTGHDYMEVLPMMRHAAQAGNPTAIDWLAGHQIPLVEEPGVLYVTMPVVPKRSPLPIPEWLTKDIAAKNFDGPLNYCDMLMSSEHTTVPGDTVHGLILLRQMADAGSPRAQREVGRAYWEGNGLAKDTQEALRWLSKADAAGDRSAAYTLAGIAYSYEPGHPANMPLFRKWAARSVALNPSARTYYYMGVAESQLGHPVKEREWFLKAAQSGEKNAQLYLAQMEWGGIGGPKDDVAGAKHLEDAAFSGVSQAEYELGVALLYGKHGLAPDPQKAFKYFLKASYYNNPKAAHIVAVAFYRGIYLEKDHYKAYQHAITPAKLGSPEDQLLIARLLQSGDENRIAHSPAESLSWMKRAAAAGSKEAQAELANGFNGLVQIPKKQ